MEEIYIKKLTKTGKKTLAVSIPIELVEKYNLTKKDYVEVKIKKINL